MQAKTETGLTISDDIIEICLASENNAQLIKYGVLQEMNTFGIQLCLMFI